MGVTQRPAASCRAVTRTNPFASRCHSTDFESDLILSYRVLPVGSRPAATEASLTETPGPEPRLVPRTRGLPSARRNLPCSPTLGMPEATFSISSQLKPRLRARSTAWSTSAESSLSRPSASRHLTVEASRVARASASGVVIHTIVLCAVRPAWIKPGTTNGPGLGPGPFGGRTDRDTTPGLITNHTSRTHPTGGTR